MLLLYGNHITDMEHNYESKVELNLSYHTPVVQMSPQYVGQSPQTAIQAPQGTSHTLCFAKMSVIIISMFFGFFWGGGAINFQIS